MLNSSLYLQEDSEQDNGHFWAQVQKKKWYSISEDSPQGVWGKIAESGHPIFRATSPLSRAQLKSKGGGKLSIHYCADLETIETVFRTIISVNRLSLYGAVATMCEEYESFHDRPGKPVVGGQSSSSFVPSDSSSSTCKTTKKRRWWSDCVLENQRQSSEILFPALSSLVWRQVEEKHGRRRRKQEKISSLYLFTKNYSAPPSSSRSFRMQFHGSYFTRQCYYSGRFLQVHLSCRMCNRFPFDHQFGIDTWRSKNWRQTDSILSACGSHGQKPKGSWHDRLGSTRSCAIYA